MTTLGGDGWCDLKMALRVSFKYRGVCIYTYFVVAYFVCGSVGSTCEVDPTSPQIISLWVGAGDFVI